uniref:Potassium channel toxin alpha-KTx J123 n=1 Tax=Olivierus martensii TaxID=34649 RepID=KA11M_OLIMR|nr:RecName: Full=Potassium channel toxin alpha-KTx J123; Flags: Precursor [Mesobuthus martensii]ABM87940.1 potassium channel toxin-like peptide [Mesobuthus martensii]
MNKVYLVAVLVLFLALTINESNEAVPTGGCPFSDFFCAKRCKDMKFGNTGRCTGPNKTVCKCSI